MASFYALDKHTQVQELERILQIVNPARGFATCIGTTVKPGSPRCQTSSFGVRVPSSDQLRRLPKLARDKTALEAALRDIVFDFLCPRWHRTKAQEDAVVFRWLHIVMGLGRPPVLSQSATVQLSVIQTPTTRAVATPLKSALLSNETRLDLISILEIINTNPGYGWVTCVGVAKSYRPVRRCSNKISRVSQDRAIRRLQRLLEPAIDVRTLRAELSYIASALLCPQNHKDQQADVVQKWLSNIQECIADRPSHVGEASTSRSELRPAPKPTTASTTLAITAPQTPPRQRPVLPSASSSPANPCPICREEVGYNGGRTTLPCGHMHCRLCIQAWRDESGKTECPLCRNDPEKGAREQERARLAEETRVRRQMEARLRREEGPQRRESEESSTLSLSDSDVSDLSELEEDESEDDDAVLTRPSTPSPVRRKSRSFMSSAFTKEFQAPTVLCMEALPSPAQEKTKVGAEQALSHHSTAKVDGCTQVHGKGSLSNAPPQSDQSITIPLLPLGLQTTPKSVQALAAADIVAAITPAKSLEAAQVITQTPAPAFWEDVNLLDTVQKKSQGEDLCLLPCQTSSLRSPDIIKLQTGSAHLSTALVRPAPHENSKQDTRQSELRLSSIGISVEDDQSKVDCGETMTYQFDHSKPIGAGKSRYTFFGLFARQEYQHPMSRDTERFDDETNYGTMCLTCIDVRPWLWQTFI